MQISTCIFIVLTTATATAGAQSGFYRPLTLASADEATDTGGSAAKDEAKASAFSVDPAAAGSPDHTQMTADEIAKQLANPNNSLASLTFKNQFRWYEGDLPGADDKFNYTLLFQPVFPFTMPDSPSGGKANLFIRPAVPIIVEQPVPNASGGWDNVSGLGDIQFDLAYGVTEKSGLLWAFGMDGTLPTATDTALAGKQLRLGPEMFIAQFGKNYVLGIFPSHQWNVTGWSDQYYATTTIQPILEWLPGGGWSIGSLGLYNYDWVNKQWTVPVNLTIQKTVKIGSTPWKFGVEINYYLDHADAFGPKWMIGFNVTPVVKNVFNSWIHGE